MNQSHPVEAVTFDFYNTLVFHRDGRGRGRVLIEYLEEQGFEHAPWEHSALYDVFEPHDRDYEPAAPQRERDAYYLELAERVFRRLAVRPDGDPRQHSEALWEILGPASFDLFSDVVETLEHLTAEGYPLALISNWQSGVRHFCQELGIAKYFDHVLGSADLGVAKPDPRMFVEAVHRLAVPADRVLHVGDTFEDDFIGGSSAGLSVVLIDRGAGVVPPVEGVIRGLVDLRRLLAERAG
jgi:HAD superfamily hydrolase (TIGR01549 family)